MWIRVAAVATYVASSGCLTAPMPAKLEPPAVVAKGADDGLRDPREVHFGAVRQLTRGQGENAEAYWSADGKELIFQTKRPPYGCDQIMRLPADGAGPTTLVSTGKGQTTCSYFFPDGKRVLYSSTHEQGDACPAPPDRSQGYVWKLHDFDIFSARPDGSDVAPLTRSPGYDAEATICSRDGSIVFTSTRDGDLELYRMDADGKRVIRLTDAVGYDGGAFFSADCSQLVWRSSRPQGDALVDYRRLLGEHMVRPTQLEIMVARVTPRGLEQVRQVTHLQVASFAPFFHPSGQRILFSSNYGDLRGREFDIWAVDTDGTDLERITYTPGFDGFPMFSPDGTKLAFGSNRHSQEDGETDVYVAEWIDGKVASEPSAADRFMADVAWLADDAREGRGVGTSGLAAAADHIERRMRALGIEPGVAGGYRQEFDVVARQVRGAGEGVSIRGKDVAPTDFAPDSSSAVGQVEGDTVFVGYGIVAPELGRDDYRGRNVKGKVAVVRRFVPPDKAFADPQVENRYGDLQYKAAMARQRGAVALLVVDVPDGGPAGASVAPEAALPGLRRPPMVDAGLPVVVVARAAAGLILRPARVEIAVDLQRKRERLANLVGVVRAGAPDRLPGVVVVGAHYDHLGYGDESSLEPSRRAPHNGADDNASGVAGLLEIGRSLVARRAELRRDVWLVGFTAEEIGVLGSDHLVKHPPPGLAMADVVAMINLDMIGRLGDRSLTIGGGDTAREWRPMATAACARAGLRCQIGGDGYGPSDHRTFYAVGIPVLFFFSGNQPDYHKTTDDSDRIAAASGARIAEVAADVVFDVDRLDHRMAVVRMGALPLATGDVRGRGGSLGTVPNYSDDRPGVLLDDVRPDGPAARAGLRRGDRLLFVGDREVRTVQDLTSILMAATPGTRTAVVFERGGQRLTAEATFGTPMRH